MIKKTGFLLSVLSAGVALSCFADDSALNSVMNNLNSNNSLFNPAKVPSFATSQSAMSTKSASCGTNDFTSLLKSKKSSINSKAKSSLNKSCSGISDVTAAMKDNAQLCELPISATTPSQSCEDFFAPLNDLSTSKGSTTYKRWSSTDPSKASSDFKKTDEYKRMACYVDVAAYKAATCGDQGLDEIKKSFEALKCQMDALRMGVNDASKQVNQIMQQNSDNFQKMLRFEAELNQQKAQVDEILGPDPELGQSQNAQFGGLLALEKKMQDALVAYKKGETEFTNDIQQIKDETTKNEQTLQASSMGVVVSCMNGDRSFTTGGSKSLMCYKPRAAPVGPDGKPMAVSGGTKYEKQSCSPMEYVRAQAEQSAYRGADGKVRGGAFRADAANERAARFDSVMQSIMRDFGAYEQPAEGGAKLQTRIQNSDQFLQKYGNTLSKLSSDIQFDVSGGVKKIVDHCFGESNIWKTQQINSAASPYRQKLAEIKRNKVKLRDSLDTGLTTLNSDYADVVATLSGQHVALDRFKCGGASGDLDGMENCYKAVERNLTDLLEGNSNRANTFVTKQITGGTMTQGFGVTCNGIKGCITNLKQVREALKRGVASVKQQRAQWTEKGNSAVMKAISGFATGSISALQKNVQAQYDAMTQLMVKYKIGKAPGGLNPTTAETLQQMDGPNGEKGPYQAPKDMAAVLAGMMQPPLIKLDDPGFQAAMDSAIETMNDRSKEMKNDLKDMREAMTKYDKLKDEINKGCGGTIIGEKQKNDIEAQEKDEVNNNDDGCSNCKEKVYACSDKLKGKTDNESTSLATQLSAILDAANASPDYSKTDPKVKQSLDDKFSKARTALKELTLTGKDCDPNIRTKCDFCVDKRDNATSEMKKTIESAPAAVQ